MGSLHPFDPYSVSRGDVGTVLISLYYGNVYVWFTMILIWTLLISIIIKQLRAGDVKALLVDTFVGVVLGIGVVSYVASPTVRWLVRHPDIALDWYTDPQHFPQNAHDAWVLLTDPPPANR